MVQNSDNLSERFEEADLVPIETVRSILKEGNELANIIGKSVVTSKKRASKERCK